MGDDADDFEVIAAADDVAERPVNSGGASRLGDIEHD